MSQQQGNDLAAPEPLATTDAANPPEAIEDKLTQLAERYSKDILLNDYNTAKLNNFVESIQAIITTETTKARIDELEGMPHTTSIKPYVHERIAALQKEQNQ